MASPDLSYPVAPPPAGVTSNFANPPNQAALAYSTLVVSLALVTFFTWFRFLVKLCIVRTLHLEDYLIPFAWLAAIGNFAPAFIIYDFAPIIHSWDMQLHDFGRFLLYFQLGAVFYNISILLVKLAMLVQVLRIFVPRGSQSKTFYVIHFLIWTNTIYYTVIVFMMAFNCHPIRKAWNPWIPGKCLEIGVIAMATATFNVISDLAILFLSQKVIWNVMRVDTRQRIRLAVVFCAGIVPCGFSAMCLYYNHMEMHSTDFIQASAFMSLACFGEITSGMFVLFLPVLPRFFTYLRERRPLLHRRAPSKLEFSDVGIEDGAQGKNDRNLSHPSWIQRISDGDGDGERQKVWVGRKASEDFFDGKVFESRSYLSTVYLRDGREV